MKNTSKAEAEYLSFLKMKESNIFFVATVLVIILGNRNAPTAVYVVECGAIHVAPLIFGYPKGKTEMPERREPKVE